MTTTANTARSEDAPTYAATNSMTTTPCTGQPSEGHTSAVNVLRMVNTRHQHQAAEPVPFRNRPAPLRSIKPAKAEAATHHSCATSAGLCMGSANCADHHCQGHPANDVREDERDDRLTLIVWGVYLAIVAAAVFSGWQWVAR